jgi:hypothetical protein
MPKKITPEEYRRLVAEITANKLNEKLQYQEWCDNFKIGIKFHDNDFYLAFYGVLSSIDNAIAHGRGHSDGLIKMNKKQWAILINDLLIGSYYLWQNQFSYTNGYTFEEYKEHTRKYLTIETKRILLNDEVNQYLEKNPENNGETFILDRSLPDEKKIFTL